VSVINIILLTFKNFFILYYASCQTLVIMSHTEIGLSHNVKRWRE